MGLRHKSVLRFILLFFLCLCFVGCGSDDFTIPTAPTGVTATPGNNQVTIAWTPVAGATSYNIYWSTTTGVPGPPGINNTPIYGATNPYTLKGLTTGTTYYFVVTAVKADVESPTSVQVSAIPT